MADDRWTYPVLWVNALGGIWVAKDEGRMLLGDKKSVTSAALLTGQFFDASLRHWKVTGAQFIKYRPYLSEWRDYPFQRVGTISLETKALGVRSLSEVQEMVCDTISRDTEFWESGANAEELKRAVRSTHSVQDLVAIFD